MNRFILLSLLLVPLSAPAFALSDEEVRQCQAMAATFGPKKAEFDRLTEERDQLADAAEAAGETWENAEALRNFSLEAQAEADAKRIAYDSIRAEFDQLQYAWSSTGQQLNADFSAFNAKCAAKE